MKLLGYRPQRTLAGPAEITGVGFLTGAAVRMRFLPAPPSTGVIFVRSDVPSRPHVPAIIDLVTGTQRRTTLGCPPASVALVEHVLAALAGLRIDNCYIELNAPEAPGLDGSAQGYVRALHRAGIVRQPAPRAVWTVERTVLVECRGATLAVHPGHEDFKISYHLDYGPRSPIARQTCTRIITPQSFASDIAPCRTFLLEEEATELRRQGLGARTTAADLIVFGRSGPIANRLRHADEPARHKVLDLVGDLALFGEDLRGHVVGYRSGHPLNIELVRALCSAQRQHRGVAAWRAAA